MGVGKVRNMEKYGHFQAKMYVNRKISGQNTKEKVGRYENIYARSGYLSATRNNIWANKMGTRSRRSVCTEK